MADLENTSSPGKASLLCVLTQIKLAGPLESSCSMPALRNALKCCWMRGKEHLKPAGFPLPCPSQGWTRRAELAGQAVLTAACRKGSSSSRLIIHSYLCAFCFKRNLTLISWNSANIW